MTPQKIILLGSTGSIGRSTLDVIQQHPGHFDVIALTAYANVDLLLATGPLSEETVKAARTAGMNTEQARHFADKKELADFLCAEAQVKDVVLIKASRAMQLEEVVERIF